MFVREYGLVHNASNPERYVRLVRWEDRWVPMGDMEMRTRVPVAWEYRALDGKLVPVAITELAIKNWPVTWPREAAAHLESEEMRRLRIRMLRVAGHVDEAEGAVEPAWVELDSHEEVVPGAVAG